METNQHFELYGKTAFVTGASQGLGRGIALQLAKAGANVVIADLNYQKATLVVDEIKALGPDAIAVECDVTDEKSIKACREASLTHFLQMEILVNNAGIHSEKIDSPSTVEQFNQCLDVNLIGVWRVVQAFIPHFKQQGHGTIINIASVNGRKPWVDTPAYSASKAGVINLTQSLATTLGPDNINVNAVCPGGVITAMADAFTDDRDAMQSRMANARPLKRALSPEDIGKAVVFFASPMARNITGQSLNVDGGVVLN